MSKRKPLVVKAPRKRKPLTLKALGHVAAGGRFWLSQTYANARHDYKVVELYIIGYAIVGYGHRSPVRVAPIYRAEIWRREAKKLRITQTHEVGDYFNSLSVDGFEDHTANAIAASIRSSLGALEQHQADKAYAAKRRK